MHRQPTALDAGIRWDRAGVALDIPRGVG